MLSSDTPERRAAHPGRSDADTLAFARDCARIAADSKCEDVVILDLRGRSAIADAFVIATGTSDRQMAAVADLIRIHSKSLDRLPFRSSDPRDGKWVLADYVDVVVHLFDEEHRDFYDLEGMWGDAPRLMWSADDHAASDD